VNSFLAALLLLVFAGVVFAENLPTVTAVEVKGLRRIEEGALRSKLTQRIGEQLSQEKTTEDIKAIYRMGYFDDVKTELVPFEGGIKVQYIVKEKPTIIKVAFQGNKEFDDKELREKMPLVPGAISDVTLINDNAIKLRTFYEEEGYYLVKIVPIVKKVNDLDVEVTYQIEEGAKVVVKDILFTGNKNLSAGKLRGAMKTKTRKIYSFVLGGGYYKKEEMHKDVERIRERYYEYGYIKVQVGEPKLELTADKRGMIITIPVQEGEQFTVASVAIAGNKAFPEKDLRPLIKLMPKKVFNGGLVKKDIIALVAKHADNGYAVASVFPDLSPDDTTREVKVTYRIEEGLKFNIGRIDISGNSKTKDKVIRREVRLNEGDIFSAAAMKRSYERLNNLGYFEKVDLNPKPRPDDQIVDLDVNVKEKNTGFLTLGGGYSSTDGLLAMVDITQTNLFGGGQYLKWKGELGTKMRNAELSYRDPWFMDEKLSFGATLYKNDREYGLYERRSKGLELSLGKELSEYWHASTAYNFDISEIFNVREDAAQSIKDEAGKWTTSSISFMIARDTRDNYQDPLAGSRNTYTVAFAGLGGNVAFLRNVFDSQWFFQTGEYSTIRLRGKVGYITSLFDKELPLFQRFYIGGLDTIRGVGYGKAGPLDATTGEARGGEKYAVANVEYIFPIIMEYKFKGVVFVDAGRAWDKGEAWGSDLRYTSGFGIRWHSPFGPIRVEYGFNLNKKPGESAGKVEFGMGSAF
jgi:outer membrane protein insertion porin family